MSDDCQPAPSTTQPVFLNERVTNITNKLAPSGHLPTSVEGLLALSDTQRTLLAAATVSGCDAVAYYAIQDGNAVLQQSLDLYPMLKTTFPEHMTFNSHTHDGDAQVRHSTEYHIPVRGLDNSLQGFVVLHAPTDELNHLQNDTEAVDPNNLKESPAERCAKLTIAEHIIEKQKVSLLPPRQKAILSQRANPQREKQEYFKMLREDFIQILGAQSLQADHVNGVASLMMLTVDKVINTPEKTIIDDAHKSILNDLTVLHDVGKLQAAVPFLVKRWRPDAATEDQTRNHYFMGRNHNHPLFSYLALSAYPHEAMLTAAHHHGLLRHNEKELHLGLGKDKNDYVILKNNIPFNQLSALSKFMRVCDVTESITGGRAKRPLANALQELAERAGYNASLKTASPVTPSCNTIDPDILCMMIDHGFFQAYGQMREQQTGGWKDTNGAKQYNEQAVDKLASEVLEAFHWRERKAVIEQQLRTNVAQDRFITEPVLSSPSRTNCIC